MLRHTAGRLACSAVCSSMPRFCRPLVTKYPAGGGSWRPRPLLRLGQLTSCQPWASVLLCCAASQLQNALQHVNRRPTYTASVNVYLVGVPCSVACKVNGYREALPVASCPICHRLNKA